MHGVQQSFKLWIFPPRRLMPKGDQEKYHCRRRQMLLETDGKCIWLSPYCGYLVALALDPESGHWSGNDLVELFWPDADVQPDYGRAIVYWAIAELKRVLEPHGLELVVHGPLGRRGFSLRRLELCLEAV